MTSLISKLFARTPKTHRNPTPCRLGVETLGDRVVPASVSWANGILNISAVGGGEAVSVRVDPLNGGGAKLDVTEAGRTTTSVVPASVTRIVFTGSDRADTFINTSALPVTAYGRGGNDFIQCGNGADFLDGGDGDDTLVGWEGNDAVYGRSGRDTLWGGGGNDSVDGGDGDDFVHGGLGDDSLFGGGGNDTLRGADGNDMLSGGAGNDWLEAGSAAESAVGGDGTDWNAHVWAVNGTTANDVYQTGVSSCVILSAASAAAHQSIPLATRISYLGDFTYSVSLYDVRLPKEGEVGEGGQWVSVNVRFDGTLTTYNGNQLDPRAAAEGESWVILLQRAYLQQFYGISPTDGAALRNFDGELGAEWAVAALTGRTASTHNEVLPSAATLQTALSQGKVVTAGSYRNQNDHSYSVLRVYQVSGEWRIDVRNPWGKDQNPNNLPAIKDSNPNDGVITLKYTDFVKCFSQVTIG